jgi:hypothetical protein
LLVLTELYLIFISGSRWRVKELSYRVSKYPSAANQMSTSDIDSEVRKALNVWSDYTDLNFNMRRSGKVHIDIRFEKGEHGDGDPFDGSGGTLAHAFFPVFGGDAHFDDKEFWTMESFRGRFLFSTFIRNSSAFVIFSRKIYWPEYIGNLILLSAFSIIATLR